MRLNRRVEQLYKEITEGGEGIIYDCGENVIKIYKDNVNKVEKEKKIKMLLQLKNKLSNEVVLPLDIVEDANGKFIGYVMRKVDGEEIKRLANKKFTEINGISTKDKVEILRNIEKVVGELHRNKVFIGDLNDQNILIDTDNKVSFIDCDSWSIGGIDCTVAMDEFKDPLLKGSNFNEGTDMFAFSVLAWRSLTRIHPYGGVMEPDMGIEERMTKGIHCIDNDKVKLPRIAKGWKIYSPKYVDKMKQVFEHKTRDVGDVFKELLELKYCDIDNEYYYKGYTECPLCNSDAKVMDTSKPESRGTVNSAGIRLVALYTEKENRVVLNNKVYIEGGYVVSRDCRRVQFNRGKRYDFIDCGVVVSTNDEIKVVSNTGVNLFSCEKRYKTPVYTLGNRLYYIESKMLVEVNIDEKGINHTKRALKGVGREAYYSIDTDTNGNLKYCIVNKYDTKVLIDVGETAVEYDYKGKISEYGITMDKASGNWLVTLMKNTGKTHTIVVGKKGIEYETDRIHYNCSLDGICMSNKTLFIPVDGLIRGFAYEKNVYKDFECSVIRDDSKLVRSGAKFEIVNNENLYEFG